MLEESNSKDNKRVQKEINKICEEEMSKYDNMFLHLGSHVNAYFTFTMLLLNLKNNRNK